MFPNDWAHHIKTETRRMEAGQQAYPRWCCLPQEVATRGTLGGRFITPGNETTGEPSSTEEPTDVSEEGT